LDIKLKEEQKRDIEIESRKKEIDAARPKAIKWIDEVLFKEIEERQIEALRQGYKETYLTLNHFNEYVNGIHIEAIIDEIKKIDGIKITSDWISAVSNYEDYSPEGYTRYSISWKVK
jgi:hypothetical protein